MLNTLTNVFATNKRVYPILRLNLKALQPLTWRFPSDPQRYLYSTVALLYYLKIPMQRFPPTSTKIAFWYFLHCKYYLFKILSFIEKSYKNT